MGAELIVLDVMWLLFCVTYLVHGTYMSLSIFSINTNLRKRTWTGSPPPVFTPLCLVVPLYREDEASVTKTFTSISKQDYPPSRARVIVVVEEGDDSTLKAVENGLHIFEGTGFAAKLVVKPPPRSTKAAAINHVLNQIEEPVIGIYDGGDVIDDKRQLQRAAGLLASGCDGIGVRVIRGGRGFVSTFSWVDTTMWCDVTLPALTYLFKSPLLSGEGLFIKRDVVQTIGGFPNSLTEDAYLTLLFAQRGFKMALLDSTVYEGAPIDLSSLIRQKLRWHKGTFLCLRQTLISDLPIRRKLALSASYSGPIVMIAISLSIITLVTYALVPSLVPGFFAWWSLFIVITTVTAPIYLAMAKYKVSLTPTLILPLYWFVVGLLTLYALVSPRISWYKTLRRAEFNPSS